MELKYHKLSIKNCKGIKDLTIEFAEHTCISGPNESGKSSVADIIFWIFFDTNQYGKSEFGLKPETSKGEPIYNLENEAEIEFSIDGVDHAIKKVRKEVWSKDKGKGSLLKNHKTEYFINMLPAKVADYKKFIAGLFDPYMFKLLSSPLSFPLLHWEKRREMIIPLTRDVDQKTVLGKMIGEAVEYLNDALNDNQNISDLKKIIEHKIKDVEKEKQAIPAKKQVIDEMMPGSVNVDDINKEIEVYQNRIKLLNSSLSDANKKTEVEIAERKKLLDKKSQLNISLMKVKAEVDDIELASVRKLRDKKDSLKTELEKMVSEKENLNKQSTALSKTIEGQSKKLDKLREKAISIHAEKIEIEKVYISCPNCSESFELDEKSNNEKISNLKNDKSERFNNTKKDGVALHAELTENTKNLEVYYSKIQQITEAHKIKLHEYNMCTVPEIDPDYSKYEKYNAIVNEQAGIDCQIKEEKPIDTSEVDRQITGYTKQIDELKEKLTLDKKRIEYEEIIKGYQRELIQLTRYVNQLYQALDYISDYEKTKSQIIENDVNGRLKNTTFKLFDTHQNGNPKPCCEIMYKGHTYGKGLNTAGEIQAGCEIINALSEHYKMKIPVIIDNKESVSEIPEMQNQVIMLKVDETKKGLTIN